MVGILVSFWDGLFSGAVLVSGRVIALYRNLLFTGSVGIRSPSIFDGHGKKHGKTHLQTPKSPAQFAWNLQLWVSLVITFDESVVFSDAKRSRENSTPPKLQSQILPNMAKTQCA